MARKKKDEHHDADATDPVDAIETIEAKTLRGDVRDAVLREFKAIDKPYSKMNEAEQQRIIDRADDIARLLVNRAVEIAAHAGAPHLIAEVGQWGVKEGLKIQLTAAATLENGTQLLAHHGPAVLVLIEPSKFKGQRAKVEPDVVGTLAMPRGEPAGVHGDELPDLTPGGDATEHAEPPGYADPGPIPPALDRRNGAGPSQADPPFAAPPDEGVRHVE